MALDSATVSKQTPGRCAGTNKRGKPCESPPSPGGSWCLMHDPARADLAAEVQRKGGAARMQADPLPAPEVLPPADYSTADASRRSVEMAVDATLSGRLPIAFARLIVWAVASTRAERDEAALEARIAALEAQAALAGNEADL